MKTISKIISVKKIIKEAFAQPLSPEKAREWAGRGQFQSPNVTEELPKGHGKKEYDQILEETGAKGLFGNDLPKMRKFYAPQEKHIVFIDGVEYFLVGVEKSKDVGRDPNKRHIDGYFQVFGPVVRKPNRNRTIDWKATDTNPKNFSYDQYSEQVKRSPEVVKEKVDLINDFINDNNTIVEKSEDKEKGTVTVLPLQLDRAERMLKKRLETIKSIQEEVEEPSAKGKTKIDKAKEDIQSLREDVLRGRTQATPANYAVSVLETKFHSTNTLQELKEELQTLQPPFDANTNETLLKYLNRVVDWQIQKRLADEAKKVKDKEEREERIESDLPEMKEFLFKQIKPIEKLPGQYDKAQGYFGTEFVGTQQHEIQEGTSNDYDELSAVLGSLERARQTIIDLPKATNEYLMGEGKVRLNQIMSFIDNAKLFAKRYKEPVLVQSEEDPNLLDINPKLFSSTSAGLGNALIAVVLNQLIGSVTNEINRIVGKIETPSSKELQPQPEQVERPVELANNQNKIKRMSELLWKAFEDRMTLK